MGQCYNAAKSVLVPRIFEAKCGFHKTSFLSRTPCRWIAKHLIQGWRWWREGYIYIYIDDIWFSIFLWAKFEAWDLQNAAQNLSVVAQEPPFLVLLNRSGIAGIFLRPKEGLTERLCCHRVSQRGVLWQIHNISVAALPVISWYFQIFLPLCQIASILLRSVHSVGAWGPWKT